MISNKKVRVGIGVMIIKDEKALIGLRKSSHGSGEWSFPGGHLELGETVFETAKRETMEETGLDVDQFKVISVADEMRYLKTDDKHYLNITVKAVYKEGEPKVCEPEKCEKWEWFNLDDLPTPLFQGTEMAIKNYKNKRIYIEVKASQQ